MLINISHYGKVRHIIVNLYERVDKTNIDGRVRTPSLTKSGVQNCKSAIRAGLYYHLIVVA